MTADRSPNREDLLAICERAFVPEEKWSNRDSSAAQRQLGECYALLRAGCEFYVHEDDRQTLWVSVEFYGFDSFEWGLDEVPRESEQYYLPTAERLDARDGKDWY